MFTTNIIADAFIGKETRTKKAKDHVSRMETRYSNEINNAVLRTRIYRCPPYVKDIFPPYNCNYSGVIILRDCDAVKAIIDETLNYDSPNITVLNFASYKNPGGKFMEGSQAQEESLCHESFLYNVLFRLDDLYSYYSINKQDLNYSLYRNVAAYTPDVVFERQDHEFTFFGKANVITCAAPNVRAARDFAMKSNLKENINLLNSMELKSRIKFVLDIAEANRNLTAEHKNNVLILGAFGCGVFDQNPEEVAIDFVEALFNELGKLRYGFDRIIFAIPDAHSKNYKTFSKVFNKMLYK